MAQSFNPFTPNQPIDPEYFAGRIGEVVKVKSALSQTRHGKIQHVLLTGERGIGKTSLAIYAQYLGRQPNETLGTDFNFATSYYTVERNQNLADICRGLTAKLLDGIDRGLASKCFNKLKDMKLHFAVQVPWFGQFGLNSPDDGQGDTYLHTDFVKAIEESWDEMKETHNGILLILDELHNLNTFKGVGSFFKVVSERLVVDGYRQIMFLATGLPKIASDISEDDPSAPRIFTYVELNRLTEDESLSIVNRCISNTSKTIDDQAAKHIAMRSGGFPYFLHQLGYDAFDADTDDLIDLQDVYSGLVKSLIQFERMFFGKMYKSVEGKQKQKIVDELAHGGNIPVLPSQLEKKLKIKNIHQYLRSLEKDGIIERYGNSVKLSSDLLSIYIVLFKTAPRKTKQESSRAIKAAASSD